MKPLALAASDTESAARLRIPIDDRTDLPGGWVSEHALSVEPLADEPDVLAHFPSELVETTPLAAVQWSARVPVVSPVVEPSEAERHRVFPPPARLHVPVKRLSDAASVMLGALAVGAVTAAIVLGIVFWRGTGEVSAGSSAAARVAAPTAPPSPTPINSPAPTPVVDSKPTMTLADVFAPPPDVKTPPRDSAPARRAPAVTRSTSAKAQAAPARPTPLPTSVSNAATWRLASSIASVPSPPPPTPTPDRVVSPAPAMNVTSVPTPAASPIVTPTAATPTLTPPTIAPTPVATPAAPPPAEPSARVARTASVQTVLDRYRNAYDSLDAEAVKGFWPDVDVRALNRAFAQLDSQRFQFDHCDIELAGSRAFASCRGYAQFVKKAGAREMRQEPRQWSFTFGEVKNGWVILSVDARAGQ